MNITPAVADPAPRPAEWESRAALALAVAVAAAAFLLMSPPHGRTYPGAIPWKTTSLLKPLIDVLTLGGWVETARGVEIKDFALHIAAALGLLLAAVRYARATPAARPGSAGPVTWAIVLLAGWVLLSLLSGLWSQAPDVSRGQALLYALLLGWAVSLAATLDRRDVPALLYSLLVITAVGGALCLWYFRERNPFHRPGFPIGNPSSLAAAMVPGLLTGLALLGSAGGELRRTGRLTARRAGSVGAVVVALVPIVGCLGLTRGRGALLGILAGLATMGYLLLGRHRVGRWVRWGLVAAFGLAIVAAGAWWSSRSQVDVTMARGATVRFRLYAWRYAAELWGANAWAQVAGQGAGAYPRLAGTLAVHDRVLDPAAFMGEIVEHAHNELFEVLTEIGLVGGVTFVGGFVATLLAGAGAAHSAAEGTERWLRMALVGAIVGLLADAMTGVALRLPGVPALFWTLVGTLWAVSRASPSALPGSRTEVGKSDERATPSVLSARCSTGGQRAARVVSAGVCLLAAAGAGWTGLRNWQGVQHEQAAETLSARAEDEGTAESALSHATRAEAWLLDPVRKIIAGDRVLHIRYGRAANAVRSWLALREAAADPQNAPAGATASVNLEAARRRAIVRAQEAHEAAYRLARRAPALESTLKVAARSAELLATLEGTADAERGRAWLDAAERTWRQQRTRTPLDVETLLALTQYRASFESHVALLRDALRFGGPQGYWKTRLAELADQPGFEDVLGRFLAAAGPITPATDADTVVLSMAPETRRLAAAWLALQGDLNAAADEAHRAAELYLGLRPRLPTLHSVALAEEAEYRLRAGARPEQAVELLEQAIAALPRIQEQKYEELVQPFRFRLALALLAAGQTEAAVDVVIAALGELGRDVDAVEQALQRVVYSAAAAGHSPALLERITAALCPQYPTFCGAGSRPTP